MSYPCEPQSNGSDNSAEMGDNGDSGSFKKGFLKKGFLMGSDCGVHIVSEMSYFRICQHCKTIDVGNPSDREDGSPQRTSTNGTNN